MCIIMESNICSYHVNSVQCFTPLQPFELKNNQCDVNDKQGIENKLIHLDDIAYKYYLSNIFPNKMNRWKKDVGTSYAHFQFYM